MKFRRYQKLERFGRPSVRGIEAGECFVFHKLDGTNASVWYIEELDEIRAGSRNRPLTFKKDNANFFETIHTNENIKKFFRDYPKYRLYGEFLVPHTLKTYEDTAWREFYVFDVLDETGDETRYLHYYEYKKLMDKYNIPYIPAIAKVVNGSYDTFVKLLDKADYLIKDGCGAGEGIVIKNYDFKNYADEVVWAKIVSNEFKSNNAKLFGEPTIENKPIEDKIINKYCTESFIEKEFAKILNSKDGVWDNKYIPELLGRIWHEFLIEEIPQAVLDFKSPIIDFRILNGLLINKIKTTLKPKGIF